LVLVTEVLYGFLGTFVDKQSDHLNPRV